MTEVVEGLGSNRRNFRMGIEATEVCGELKKLFEAKKLGN